MAISNDKTGMVPVDEYNPDVPQKTPSAETVALEQSMIGVGEGAPAKGSAPLSPYESSAPEVPAPDAEQGVDPTADQNQWNKTRTASKDAIESDFMNQMTPEERRAYNNQTYGRPNQNTAAPIQQVASATPSPAAKTAQVAVTSAAMGASPANKPSNAKVVADLVAQGNSRTIAEREALNATPAQLRPSQAPGGTPMPAPAPKTQIELDNERARQKAEVQRYREGDEGGYYYKKAFDDAIKSGKTPSDARIDAASAARDAVESFRKNPNGLPSSSIGREKFINTPNGPMLRGAAGTNMPFVQDPVTGYTLPISSESSAEDFARNLDPKVRSQTLEVLADGNDPVAQEFQRIDMNMQRVDVDPRLSPRQKQAAKDQLKQQQDGLLWSSMRDPSRFMSARARTASQNEAEARREQSHSQTLLDREAALTQRHNTQIWQNSVKRARSEMSADPYNAPTENQINARAMKLYAEAGGGMQQPQQGVSMGAVRGPQMPQDASQDDLGMEGAPSEPMPQQPTQEPSAQSGAPDLGGRLAIGETTPMSFQSGPKGTLIAVDPDSGRVFAGANIHGRAVAIANDAVEEQMLPPGTDYILRGNPTKIMTKGGTEAVGGGATGASAREVQINPQQAEYEIGQEVTKNVAARAKSWSAYSADESEYNKITADSTRAAAEKLGLQVSSAGKPVYSTDLNEAADQKKKIAAKVQTQILAKAQELYDKKEKKPSWVTTDSSGNVTGVNAPQMPEQFKGAKQEFDTAEEQRRNQARSVAVQGAAKIEKQISDIASNVFLPNNGKQDTQLAWNNQTETQQEERDRVMRGIDQRKRLLELAGGAGKAAGSQYGRVLMSHGSAGDAALQLLNIALDPTVTGGGTLYVPKDKSSNEGVEWSNNMSAMMAAAEKTPGARNAIISALGSKVTGGQSTPNIKTDSDEFRAARTAVFNAAVTNPDLAVAWHRMMKNYASAPNLGGSNAAEENSSIMRLMNTSRKSHANYAEGDFAPGQFNPTTATEKDRAAAEQAFYKSRGTSKEQLQQQDIAKSARAYGAATYIDRASGKTMIDVRGLPMEAVNVRVGDRSVRMPIPTTAQQAMHMIASGMPYAQIGQNGSTASKVGMDNPLLKQVAENKDKNLQSTSGRMGANPGVQAATRFVSGNFGYLPQKEQRMLFETILRRNGYAERQ